MKPGTPAWSVVVVVPRGAHEVLAISRGFNRLDPALPGGDAEPTDPTPAHTAARELLEETGLVAARWRLVDRWKGERGQPVFVFFIPETRGRLRASDEGKPFWTHPDTLLTRTAQFRDSARQIFEKLAQLSDTAKSA